MALPILNVPLKSFHGNIWFSGVGITAVRSDISQKQWEFVVWNELTNLFKNSQTSRAVLEAINATPWMMVIVPAKGKEGRSNETPDSDEDATEQGDPQRFSEGKVVGLEKDDKPLGTGHGSSVFVFHTPEDYRMQQSLPGGLPDEALFHEM